MRYFLLVITALLFSLALFAQKYEPMEYDGLQYQVLASNSAGAEKPALVLFLHGGHARGEDNLKQIQLQAVKDIKDYILKNNMPAFFLVPQCPSDIWIPNRGAPGGKVEFDILTGFDHPKACNKAFTAKRLKWLFEQRKAEN